MKRIVAMILFAVCLFSTAMAEEAHFDFKQFRWGDKMEQVIAVEGAPNKKITDAQYEAEILAYQTTVAGLDAELMYMFSDTEGLFIVVYSLQEERDSWEDYFNDYALLQSVLTQKYGEPVIDETNWNCGDVLQKVYENDLDTAFRLGYLTYETIYQTDTTLIGLSMEGEMFGAMTELTYVSKEIEPVMRVFSDEI